MKYFITVKIWKQFFVHNFRYELVLFEPLLYFLFIFFAIWYDLFFEFRNFIFTVDFSITISVLYYMYVVCVDFFRTLSVGIIMVKQIWKLSFVNNILKIIFFEPLSCFLNVCLKKKNLEEATAVSFKTNRRYFRENSPLLFKTNMFKESPIFILTVFINFFLTWTFTHCIIMNKIRIIIVFR